ncbi:hypothetical protein ABEO75_05940 [Paenibacillus macerans]|uniref:hypothetical protein n=1 Tax=Paenibacillus macerans TaxID=44252 RepID=UPI003D286402
MRADGLAAKRAADTGWRTGGQAGCRCGLADGRPSRAGRRGLADGRPSGLQMQAGGRADGQEAKRSGRLRQAG